MLENSKTIYDLGFHVGQDTGFYLKKGFRVVAVEANPLLFEEGRVKFREEIESGRLILLNMGIGKEEGQFSFYVNHLHSEWSSFVEEIGARGGSYSSMTIPCQTLSRIISIYGEPYYVKIDIEGHDFIALNSLREVEKRPRYVSVENGQKPFLDEMMQLGYTSFKFINQAEVTAQNLPAPAREGNEIEHVFEFGASGAFGDEAPGEWKDYDSILVDIESYWGRPDRDANIHGWYDLHGKMQ